jgi:uncharacterized protein YjbJ (UPF0337 family)
VRILRHYGQNVDFMACRCSHLGDYPTKIARDYLKGGFMNKDIFQGDWNILKGKVKEKWGKITEDDITEIKGRRDQLLGKLQKRYGYAKDDAERELSQWEKQHENEHAHSHSNPKKHF